MKAAVLNKYGPPEVLHIEDINKPVPKADEVLVKVIAAGVNSGDSRIRGARFPEGFGFIARLAFGIFRPRTKILGNTFSGTIEEIGSEVKNLKVGDLVFGMTGMKMSAYAEYLTVKENKVSYKPANISNEAAAALSFGASTALFFLADKAQIKKDQTILINGASGSVGSFAVQIAKFYEANVTAVCGTDNVQFVKSLGAEFVIDYKEEDIFRSEQKYDLVMDTVGNISIDKALKLLNENGKFLMLVGGLKDLIKALLARGSKKIIAGSATEKKEDLEFLMSLVSSGKIKVIVDKVFNLNDIVQAHKLVDSGRKRGNIVVKM